MTLNLNYSKKKVFHTKKDNGTRGSCSSQLSVICRDDFFPLMPCLSDFACSSFLFAQVISKE